MLRLNYVTARYQGMTVSLSLSNGQTPWPEYWHVGQVELYLAQGHWSRAWVTGQGRQVKKRF